MQPINNQPSYQQQLQQQINGMNRPIGMGGAGMYAMAGQPSATQYQPQQNPNALVQAFHSIGNFLQQIGHPMAGHFLQLAQAGTGGASAQAGAQAGMQAGAAMNGRGNNQVTNQRAAPQTPHSMPQQAQLYPGYIPPKPQTGGGMLQNAMGKPGR